MEDDKPQPQPTDDLSRRAKLVATTLSEYGLHVSSPDDGDLDDVERERWEACLEIVRRLDIDFEMFGANRG